MVVVLAVALAVAFGGADQYLGSLSWHPWAHEVSLLSAPWLLLPFLAGCMQRTPRRAALLGLACTLAALAGYGLMTLSPVEDAQLTGESVAGFLRSQRTIILGGLLTGPLFGCFGGRWRTGRSVYGALATAAMLVFEPLARIPAGHPVTARTVWAVEVAVGLAVAAYVVATAPALRTHARRRA